MNSNIAAVRAAAVRYVEQFGWSVIPIGHNKKPVMSWKEYQYRPPTREEIATWHVQRLAVVCGAISGIVIAECESREDSVWWWRSRGETKTIVRSRRGFHFYFRHPGERIAPGSKFRDEQGRPRYDVRGDGSYALLPPSIHAQGRYEWVDGCEFQGPDSLPVFKPAWRPAPKTDYQNDRRIGDGAAYIRHIVAEEGNGGDKATFRAAMVLRQSGLDETTAMAVLSEWNQTNAKPPWSTSDLLRKIKCAYGEPAR